MPSSHHCGAAGQQPLPLPLSPWVAAGGCGPLTSSLNRRNSSPSLPQRLRPLTTRLHSPTPPLKKATVRLPSSMSQDRSMLVQGNTPHSRSPSPTATSRYLSNKCNSRQGSVRQHNSRQSSFSRHSSKRLNHRSRHSSSTSTTTCPSAPLAPLPSRLPLPASQCTGDTPSA